MFYSPHRARAFPKMKFSVCVYIYIYISLTIVKLEGILAWPLQGVDEMTDGKRELGRQAGTCSPKNPNILSRLTWGGLVS